MSSALELEDLQKLFIQLLNIESVSCNEQAICQALTKTLEPFDHLEIIKDQNALMARTNLGRDERVIIAGHIDTVPVANNLPAKVVETLDETVIYGRGAADMKGGVAVMAHLAAALNQPSRDITWIFYDCEEIAASANGLNRLAKNYPEWLTADLAILMEPTNAKIEGGCQGTIRILVTSRGVSAHSARSWLGHNAIHDIADVIQIVRSQEMGEVLVDGLTYREGLNATMINGGVAGNVIPDSCSIQINYRYAPDKSAEQALEWLINLFEQYEYEILDVSPAARPGLDSAAATKFVEALGSKPSAKYGWTDVARFSALGIPALNFGPADPGKAHADDECCPVNDLNICARALEHWLS